MYRNYTADHRGGSTTIYKSKIKRLWKPSNGSRISQKERKPKRGGGCQPITWPNFPRNSMKMMKIGPGAGVCPKFYYVDPLLDRQCITMTVISLLLSIVKIII